MTLELDDMEDGVSSWVGLLRAYERFALLDEGQIVDDVCERLMRAQPEGLTKAPAPPSPLFQRLVHEVAPAQLALVEDLADERGEEGETWLAPMRHFWTETFEGALGLPFPGVRRATRKSLRELLRAAERKREQGEKPGRRRAAATDWNGERDEDRDSDPYGSRRGDGRGDRYTDRTDDEFDADQREQPSDQFDDWTSDADDDKPRDDDDGAGGAGEDW
jgi:hypothetical protein